MGNLFFACSTSASFLLMWTAMLLNKVRKHREITTIDLATFVMLGFFVILFWLSALKLAFVR